jgi:hypothetical protein
LRETGDALHSQHFKIPFLQSSHDHFTSFKTVIHFSFFYRNASIESSK